MNEFCFQLAQELEHEKQEKVRLQAFQNQLLIAQEEKFQLRNEVIIFKKFYSSKTIFFFTF